MGGEVAYKEAIVATNVLDGNIAVYYEDKMEEAKETIGEAKGLAKDMLRTSKCQKRNDFMKNMKIDANGTEIRVG